MFHVNSLAVDFKLPGGDKAKGKENFVFVDCNQCHTVYGTDVDEPRGQRRLSLPLAGEARFVRSCEELIILCREAQGPSVGAGATASNWPNRVARLPVARITTTRPGDSSAPGKGRVMV